MSYEEKKSQFVREIRKANQEASEAAEISELNEQLSEHGIVITKKVHWMPWEPVENNAHMMLKNDWEEWFSEKHPDLYEQYRKDPEAFVKELKKVIEKGESNHE